MVEDAYHTALVFGDSLLLLDRYFLTVPALKKLEALNSAGKVRMEIVTKTKKSYTAYEKPGPRKPGRGRPRKKGTAVHLKELFISHKGQFQEKKVELNGDHPLLLYRPAMGTEAVPGAAFRTSGNGRWPKHSGKHKPGIGSTGNHPALQL